MLGCAVALAVMVCAVLYRAAYALDVVATASVFHRIVHLFIFPFKVQKHYRISRYAFDESSARSVMPYQGLPTL
jgi:membrane protein YdbS with pleckstrin-like domain